MSLLPEPGNYSRIRNPNLIRNEKQPLEFNTDVKTKKKHGRKGKREQILMK
jgi:hypothetical protein